MQNASIEHANTFFMFTTVAVVIGIIILLILLYIAFKALRFFNTVSSKAYTILDKTTEVVDAGLKEGSPVKKGLSYVLPVAALFAKFVKKPKTTRKATEKTSGK